MLREVLKRNPEEEEDTAYNQLDVIKGVLCDNDEAIEGFESENSCFYVQVTVEQLSRISDLDCFVDSHRHSKAVHFAKRWSDSVDCYVKISDGDELQVEVKKILFTGEVTNKVVREFSKNFTSDLYTTFDPMAERHDEPYLSIEPW